MAYGMCERLQVSSQTDEALNIKVKCASDLENGSLLVLGAVGTVANSEDQVYTVTQPATGSLTNLYMLCADDVNMTSATGIRNISPDPREFVLYAGRVGSAFKPQVGDEILLNADAFSAAITTETFFNATDGEWFLTPSATQTASVLSFKLVATEYFPIGLGTLGSQRITGYRVRCISVGAA